MQDVIRQFDITHLKSPEEAKDSIAAMLEAAKQLPQVDCPLIHRFAHGLYAREIFMPAGTIVISKVHLQEHLTVILSGVSHVRKEDGDIEVLQAPMIFVTPPGRCRALFIIEDSVWLTVHATDAKTVEEAESTLVCEDFAEYDAKYLLLEN